MKPENKAENQKQTSWQPKLSESVMLAHADMVELSEEELTAGGVIGGKTVQQPLRAIERGTEVLVPDALGILEDVEIGL